MISAQRALRQAEQEYDEPVSSIARTAVLLHELQQHLPVPTGIRDEEDFYIPLRCRLLDAIDIGREKYQLDARYKHIVETLNLALPMGLWDDDEVVVARLRGPRVLIESSSKG